MLKPFDFSVLARRSSSLLIRTRILHQPAPRLNDVLAVIFLGLAPLFFLTVRSWTNASLILLLVLAVLDMCQRPAAYGAILAEPRVRWLALAMVSPFLAVAISQILRQDFVSKTYDAPARMLGGAVVFVYLVERRIDFTRVLQWVVPLSLFALAVSLLIDHRATHMWGRLATYFVDPLTLGQYSLLLSFFSLISINLVQQDSRWMIVLKAGAALIGIAISIVAESRSGWIAIPGLYVVWLLRARHTKLSHSLVSLLILFAVLAAAYFGSQHVSTRINEMVHELTTYFTAGNRDTSSGLRISLMRASWQMFLASPVYGFGDEIPPLNSFPAILPYFTPTLEYTMRFTGAHSELFQNMVRSGIFGMVSVVMIFVAPFLLFAKNLRSAISEVRSASFIGLSYIVAIFFFGLATELFTLKYLATFYAVIVAGTAAQVVWARSPLMPPGARA